MNFSDLLLYAKGENCSDIHITVGTKLAVRRFGELKILDDMPTPNEAKEMIFAILTLEQQRMILEGKDLDVGCMLDDGSRIRANVYHQRNNLAASIRLLDPVIPSFEQLMLPDVIEDLANLPRGLVLVTGPTGSGKTTTLASVIDYINKRHARHIMTIEDPIEYIYPHNRAMIHQREVGRDVEDFATALRSSLREDPDIILVGEMRDYETISAAVTAAETGHLVLSTLHTTSAAQTIERIIDGCPIDGQAQLRMQLANVLKGVFTQQLLPLKNGDGRIVATEVLTVNYAVSNLIRENKAYQIPSIIQSNMSSGMHSLNFDLARLVKAQKIDKKDALLCSSNPGELIKMC